MGLFCALDMKQIVCVKPPFKQGFMPQNVKIIIKLSFKENIYTHHNMID